MSHETSTEMKFKENANEIHICVNMTILEYFNLCQFDNFRVISLISFSCNFQNF